MRRAVFIDRDGVICQNRDDHVKSWKEFVFLPGALAALSRLATLDLAIVIVTNQAIINRSIVTVDVVEDIHHRMCRGIEAAGGRVDLVTYCPHRPDERCGCRKPQPGLFLAAAAKLDLDLSRSFLIGDAEADLLAGQAAGCQYRYLVLTGRGKRQRELCRQHGVSGFRVVPDLGAAVRAIARFERWTPRATLLVREGIDA